MNVALIMIILLRAAGIVPSLVVTRLGSLTTAPVAVLIFGVTSSALLAPTYVRGG